MELHRHPLEVPLPAEDGGTCGGAQAAHRLDVEIVVAQFDALAFAARQLGDDLGRAIDRHPTQRQLRARLQTPAPRQHAADAITHRGATAVEIEPQAALQLQAIGGGIGVTAVILCRMQRIIRRQQVNRQTL